LKIKISVNNVHRTYSRVIEAVPDEEFAVGDTMRFGVDEVVIHGIKVQGKMVRRGAVEARKIVRMYGKIIRRIYD
ncbi:MAG: HVO_0476 family zinc finger protein, partial [Candidatus Methanomethylophilaceae archaeon]|nr:HVO_0476 family zinc finger protein [Candidatus Methanomethylophilaceae archaeon]